MSNTQRGMLAWAVINRNGYDIDTVWFSCTMTADQVRTSLINHDGYDSDITVEISPE